MKIACPTCGHEAENLTNLDVIYWCQRCGTIGTPAVRVPELVERCRSFRQGLADADVSVACLRDNWREAGIQESINPPERRPT